MNKEEDASTFAYFSVPERTGETKDLLDIIIEVVKSFEKTLLHKYENIESYPLLNSIQNSLEQKKVTNTKNCDAIFSEYLQEVGKVTNPAYFSTVVKFTVLYRECINKYGWIKFATRMTEEEKTRENEEYVVINNAEFIPELANEFILSYLSEQSCMLPIIECINLVINFCEWLVNMGYTCTRTIKK